MSKLAPDSARDARSLYWQGYQISHIAKLTGFNVHTLYSRRRRENWDKTAPLDRVRLTTEARYNQLMDKAEKSGRDFKEIDLLARQLVRFDRQLNNDGGEGRKKLPKNHFTDEQVAQLRARFYDGIYEHQKRWYKAKSLAVTIRNILKSRQIGATWYFSREALIDALETGRNQIFLSASRAQAHQFKRFIIKFAAEAGVELKGDPIMLSNGAELHFLGTSAATAQSYTGNLYFDEYFWTSNFINLRSVAAGMATQKGLTETYFSTVSSEEHEAYRFWSGELFNEGRKKADRVTIDITHKNLKNGKICADMQWKQIVTVKDAAALGFDRIDVDDLIAKKSPDEFNNLYMCQPITNGERPFSYSELINCGVDGWNAGVWDDWRPYSPRPLGNTPVWIGYDPNGESEGGDSAGLVAIAPPQVEGGKFRVLEAIQLRGMPFELQAEEIRKMTQRYNVQFIGIDGTGIGGAVHSLVLKFFPAAMKFVYSISVKSALVLKAQMVMRRGRFEYDAGLSVIAQSFMTIRKSMTPGGMTTYTSDRSKGASHGDVAWAIMHALQNEPIGAETGSTGGGFVQEF
ncbi:TPA: terminase family protein [Yersinia enterocolitica]|uniref:terminase large subunit domain-containing protein n=1 Tax=Yersinia enterocolitica TaxID=630 RepID=UPI0005E9D033|nr:terminase family protein [Yersinia enterocolitica]ELY5303766.1 terminase family protein [Yersinia enterocolitica]CQJ09599.1 terminase%2C ATPase subunit [Yersinia enterocolitica]CQQ41072.1 terminase%2C ATPase subunit [Yersinia enterocolitica]HDL7725028.1 terminase family protein [Yersinia enterocolitica]HEN3286729.1 terminase family protein [Yersinia enterocolitica]